MKVQLDNKGSWAVVSLEGDLEVAGAEQLNQVVADLLSAKRRQVILDLTKCEYVDSSGLGALLDISKNCHRQGCALRLAGLNENVRDVFLMTRLDRYFHIASTLEEAASKLTG